MSAVRDEESRLFTIILLLACSLTMAFFAKPVQGSSFSDTVIATINVGNNPRGLAYDPVNNNMYVANQGSNTTSVISSLTNNVVDTISVGTGPVTAAFDPANNNMYVGDYGIFTGSNFVLGGNVSVIDSTTNTVVATVAVSGGPFFAAYDPANHDMYVVNHRASAVTVIDSSSNMIVATINLSGGSPEGVAYNPINNDMYVTVAGSNAAAVIDSTSNTVIDTIAVGSFPVFVAFDPANDDMYVANAGSATVSAIGTLTPAQASQNLITTVNSLGLSMGVRTSLTAPLGEVVPLLEAGKTIPACNRLSALISIVNDKLVAGQLTVSQANQLTSQANMIRTGLGCP